MADPQARKISDGIAKVTDLGVTSDKAINSFRRDDGIRVEDRLQLSHLQQLLRRFQTHRPPRRPPSLHPPRRGQRAARPPGHLTPQEFKDTVCKVLGTHDFEEQLDMLFTKLDTTCEGHVDWNEFSTYLLLQFRENDYMRAKKLIPFQEEPRIRHIVHNRQETTSKIIAVDNPTKYVTVSKEGAICVWDTSLHLERHLTMAVGDEDPRGQRRRVREWVTDVVYMANCHKIAISSTGRDLRFFDATSTQYYEEFHLYGIPDVPNCLAYYYDKKNSGAESLLMYGDDHGTITLISFLRPVTQLFATPFKKQEGVQKVYFQELYQHDKWVRLSSLEDVHPEVIRKVMYMPENDWIMSSSASPRSSIVVMDVMRKKKRYVFRINKGVECFDYSRSVNLLVTGSADHMVRIWNPYVTSKPVANLEGHAMAVVEVVIHRALWQVFSYSRDTVLKIWDIKEHSCLQTIVIKFPNSLLGRMPEYGPFSMHLQTSPSTLLVTASDYISQLRVGQAGPPVSLFPSTHLTQLCAATYNPVFKQVVTAADDSTIAVWDVETGVKAMLFTNAHGREEITSLRFDNAYRRLLTGARNGSIKIWNVQNGHNLQQLEAAAEAEVTGIVPLQDRKLVLAVGWNRRIVQYEDNDPDSFSVKAGMPWKGGQVHQEDILCIAYCPHANLVATGSYDGEIYVWSLETEMVFLQLRKHKHGCTTTPDSGVPSQRTANPSRPHSRPQSTTNSRPNSRHRASHKVPPGQSAPVDKLLFLNGRAEVKRTEAAILISSEAGVLRWWSLYSSKRDLGFFYAPERPDESVLALCSNPKDTLLVSGDTQGRIVVWSIRDYCSRPCSRRVRSRPEVESTWLAHEAAVVSVELLDHAVGSLVLSASSDRTAKLWSLHGLCVGTFGQRQPWNLQSPATWVDQPPVAMDTGDVVAPEHNGEAELNGDGAGPVEGEEGDDEVPTLERGETLALDPADPPTADPRAADPPEGDPGDGSLRLPQVKKAMSVGPCPRSLPPDDTIERSRTFAAFELGAKNKQLLGSRVQERLSRMTQNRHDRRERFLDLDVTVAKETSRMGKLCCPYGALETKDLSDIALPGNMPLTPRMLNRGMTSTALTLNHVRDMDLSYFGDSSADGPAASKPGNKGQVAGKVSDVTRSHRLPLIKKSRTQMGSLNGLPVRPDRRVTIPAAASSS